MTIDAAIVSVQQFLQPLMPAGTKIVRGQTNNVPPPLPPSIVITEVGKPQYTTTRTVLNGSAGTMGYQMPVQLRLQLDFYGNQAGEMSGIATTMLRSLYTEGKFPDGICPLYCTDGMQAPLTTGEKQYEARWIMELFMQYNAAVTVGQESFINVGDVIAIPADVIFPVE